MKKVSITVSEDFWSKVRIRALKDGKTTGRVLEDAFMRNNIGEKEVDKPKADLSELKKPLIKTVDDADAYFMPMPKGGKK